MRINKGTTIDVGKLTLELLRRKTIRPRFNLPLSEEQARAMLLAAYRAEVAYRYRQFVQSNECLRSIAALAKALIKEKPKFGIMFCGMCGNGKTTLLYAFRTVLNYLSDLHAFDERKAIRLLTAKDIAAQSKDYDRFKAICGYDMLAIDDMGREPAEVMEYGNIITPITDLLEYRYNEQLFTMITTNLTADEIRARYKTRIADRFNEMLEVIVFGGGSFRTQAAHEE